MQTRRTFVSGVVGLLGAAYSFSFAARAEARAEPLAVVVAEGSSLKVLSLYQLKQIYLGETIQNPSGRRIVPLNRGGKTPERLGFDQSVLGMTAEEATRYWIDRRIRGQSGSPKAVDPASLVQKLVERLPGAIAYVRVSEVAAGVRVLVIDGKRPGEVGYRIHCAPEPSEEK